MRLDLLLLFIPILLHLLLLLSSPSVVATRRCLLSFFVSLSAVYESESKMKTSHKAINSTAAAVSGRTIRSRVLFRWHTCRAQTISSTPKRVPHLWSALDWCRVVAHLSIRHTHNAVSLLMFSSHSSLTRHMRVHLLPRLLSLVHIFSIVSSKRKQHPWVRVGGA